MKQLSNKGFALLETLIVSTLVLSTLVFFYIQISNVKTSYDISFRYNTVPGLYKAREVTKYLTENGYSNLEELLNDSDYIDITSGSLVYGDTELYNNLILEANINRILFTYNDLTKIKNNLKGDYNKTIFNEEFKKFVTNLSSNKNGKYRVVIEYKDNTFASVSIGTGIKYDNGTVVYFNPVTGSVCDNYVAANSNTGVKTGCLKWYIFNDNYGRSTVDMILDHNTTATIAWNSTGTNTEMKEIKTELNKLVSTSGWTVTPRLIIANEIAEITGNISFDYMKTSIDGWFVFEDNSQVSSYLNAGTAKYKWLFDYTNNCTSWGCSYNDESNYGYWTSTPVTNTTEYVWAVHRDNYLYANHHTVSENTWYGIRPVITIDNSLLR